MPKSYRIKTEPGVDKHIRVNIEQDFDFLEILSLKLRQEDVYTRFCADYGVVVGRVIANGGFGIPNATISIFVPLDDLDINDPIISTLYPYTNLREKNEDGYRYNLLPYVSENEGHTPTGTFPTREDVLTRREVLQVYEKYYKYTVRTNESGDFMIVGVPLGSQKLVMDLDLSNMGEFSLRPADLVRMGMGVPSQFNGQRFKSSQDIDSLPQIVNSVQDIDVSSFWGDGDVCDVGITRADFDLRDLGIEIQPQAVFMGSIFSTTEQDFLRRNCKAKSDAGNLCDTVVGPGQILSIRQTIGIDDNGDPVLESHQLDNNGYVIDDDGVWLTELPMNLDYVITNEFGEQIISQDPSVGIPTKAKYRFKIKWMDESGLQADVMRANYLVPNIKEHGWSGPSTSQRPTDEIRNKSYAFSLSWDDYYDKEAAINCEDTFYEFYYNKVYTVASHIDRFKWGLNRARHLGIKEITDRRCQSEVNRMPINDGQRNFDFLFFVFNLLLTVAGFILIALIPIIHIALWIYDFIVRVLIGIIRFINSIIRTICKVVCWAFPKRLPCDSCDERGIDEPERPEGKGISLPSMSYPDCEACPCEADSIDTDSQDVYITSLIDQYYVPNTSALADISSRNTYEDFSTCELTPEYNAAKITFLSGYDLADEFDITDELIPPIGDPNVTGTIAYVCQYVSDNCPGDFFCNVYENICNNYNDGVSTSNYIFYRDKKFYKSPVYVNYFNWDDLSANFGLAEPQVKAYLESQGYTSSPNYAVDGLRSDINVTLSQSLNLMNQRSQYFIEATDETAPNRIRVKVKNQNFAGEDNEVGLGGGGGGGVGGQTNLSYYEDQPLILIFDANVNITAGQLLTFNETENLQDPNFIIPSNDILYTGITVTNNNILTMDADYNGEVGISWITGQGQQVTGPILNPGETYTIPGCVKFNSVNTTAPIGGGDTSLVDIIPGTPCQIPITSGFTEYNENSYITKQIDWIDWEGNIQTSDLKLFNDNPDATYKFRTGVEYFQVITAHTLSHFIPCDEYNDPNCDNIENSIAGGQWWEFANNVFRKFLINRDQTYWCQFEQGPWSAKAWNYILNKENLQVAILTRGVDPWTPKQRIEYDLSLLYGYNDFINSNNPTQSVKVIGDYFLNIPIQPNNGSATDDWFFDYKSPAPHFNVDQINTNVTYGNSNGELDITWNNNSVSADTVGNVFFPSYLYTLDTPDYDFIPFESKSLTYYSSLDKSVNPDNNNIFSNTFFFNGVGADNYFADFNAMVDVDPNNPTTQVGNNRLGQNLQEILEGGTLQISNVDFANQATQPDGLFALDVLLQNKLIRPVNQFLKPGGKKTLTLSMIYSGLTDSPTTSIDDPNKLVIRTDRLPSSDLVETLDGGDDPTFKMMRRYILNLNNFFGLYEINSNGDFTQTINLSGEPIDATDASGNLEDLTGDTTNPLYQSGVLESFTCEGMVPLTCYSGSAESFAVTDPCENEDRMVGGCYKVLRPPYISGIADDLRIAKEWRIRLRFIFGACRGVIGEMFQNNWINGSLYMPSFQKQSIFNSDNELDSYRYCGYPEGNQEYNGPLYFNNETNSFYYRSTPYGNNTFYGQIPSKEYRGANKKNIWSPTTIMELGPRDAYAKEVSFSSEFDGYIIDTIKSSSYQDNSDILNLFIIGRLVNGSFLNQIIGGNGGDASINQLFSREEGANFLNRFYDARVDGDYAQLISINSEYGVIPYIDGNYGDDITISDDRMGIWFDSNTINRRTLTNGYTTFGNDPTGPVNYFGYSKSQEVPYYMWEMKQPDEENVLYPQINLFGSQNNSWNTQNIYSSIYQGDDFFDGTTQKYMKPNFGYGLGYIYNRSSNDPQLDAVPTQNPNSNRYKVGSPFHFYFGQKRGKSAINKFIVRYIAGELLT